MKSQKTEQSEMELTFQNMASPLHSIIATVITRLDLSTPVMGEEAHEGILPLKINM